MNRWLPFPRFSLALLLTWLLLNQSFAPGHWLMGAVLALAAPYALVVLEVPPASVRRPWAIVRLFFRVLHDIIRSNIAVGLIILRPGHPQQTSGFVHIPLAMRDRYGLTTLACIITATPGTLWASYDRHNDMLVIHVLDLIDENAWIETIKGRYESLLMEIFE